MAALQESPTRRYKKHDSEEAAMRSRLIGFGIGGFIACWLAIGAGVMGTATQAAEAATQWAQPVSRQAALSARTPIVECASLTTADLSNAVGVATSINSATPVADGKPAPYCDVKGLIDSRIQF